LHKELNKLEPIVITIDSLQTGPLWMPLYKSAKFSAVAYPKLAGNERKTPFLLSGDSKTSISGRLKIAGNIEITGICSRKEASKIIRDFVVKCFTTSTKDFFKRNSADQLQGIALNKEVHGSLPKNGRRLIQHGAFLEGNLLYLV
jgi:hypothetical protein